MKSGLLVFSYDFSHKKSYFFIKEICKRNNLRLIVYAAPWISLKEQEAPKDKKYHPRSITEKYKHEYIQGSHKDLSKLKKITEKYNIKTAIIAGARIIPEEIISLFQFGVINFHPGIIPDTSGLDSFFWMIEKKSLPGITVHYIDKKVDAGEIIFFHHHNHLNNSDSLEKIRFSLLDTQIQALKRLLSFFIIDKKLFSLSVQNYSKNSPMDKKERSIAIGNFDKWKKYTISRQNKIKKLYDSVSSDNVNVLCSEDLSSMKSYKNNNGRTLLAEAAFHQSYKCVEYLLDCGFDVNAKDDKGITVLMYAKKKDNKELIACIRNNS
tara:strand:- start:681 stop:1649 length:969 start_codon:yes stop_codon:yes gene_type:complete